MTKAEIEIRAMEMIELMAAAFCIEGNVISPEHYGCIKEQLIATVNGWGHLDLEVRK